METDDLKEFALRLNTLAERLEERSQAAVEQIARTGAAMDQRAQQLAGSGDGLSRQVLAALDQKSSESLRSGLARAVEQSNAALQDAVGAATTASRELSSQRGALAKERMRWLVLGLGSLLIGLLLAISTAFVMIKKSREELARNAVEANLLRAINQADVSLCGERLCANTDDKGQRFGEHRQYRPVRARGRAD